MREFAADGEATVHPQTVIEHFGTWNAAKRAAGCRHDGSSAGRAAWTASLARRGTRSCPDGEGHRSESRRVASKSLIWHTFGSLSAALRRRALTFRSVRSGSSGLLRMARSGRALGHLPKMADWKEAWARRSTILSEWQVYRMVDVQPGAWSAFQFLVRERLLEEGVSVRRTVRRAPSPLS